MFTGAAGLGLVIWWGLLRPGPTEPIDFEVQAGSATTTVLVQLEARGLLPSAQVGRAYVVLRAKNRSLHYGWYQFPSEARPVDVLEQILDGRVETLQVTIIEGSTATEVEDRFRAAGFQATRDWKTLINDTQPIQDLSPEALSLEGYLFPDTYRFALGLAQEHAVTTMVERFRQVWTEELETTDDLWGSPAEIVTMASLVESETSVPEERARIAGVFANRLRRGMLLQCDPTVVYGLKRRDEWTGRLLRVHWLIDDPYNTYRYPGLPPGPINNPGRAALAAALRPEEHAFLYFVATPDGGHTFSRTLREHNRAVAVLQRSRR